MSSQKIQLLKLSNYRFTFFCQSMLVCQSCRYLRWWKMNKNIIAAIRHGHCLIFCEHVNSKHVGWWYANSSLCLAFPINCCSSSSKHNRHTACAALAHWFSRRGYANLAYWCREALRGAAQWRRLEKAWFSTSGSTVSLRVEVRMSLTPQDNDLLIITFWGSCRLCYYYSSVA